MKSRFTEEQIVGVLKESVAGAKTPELCRKHGITPGGAGLVLFEDGYDLRPAEPGLVNW